MVLCQVKWGVQFSRRRGILGMPLAPRFPRLPGLNRCTGVEQGGEYNVPRQVGAIPPPLHTLFDRPGVRPAGKVVEK